MILTNTKSTGHTSSILTMVTQLSRKERPLSTPQTTFKCLLFIVYTHLYSRTQNRTTTCHFPTCVLQIQSHTHTHTHRCTSNPRLKGHVHSEYASWVPPPLPEQARTFTLSFCLLCGPSPRLQLAPQRQAMLSVLQSQRPSRQTRRWGLRHSLLRPCRSPLEALTALPSNGLVSILALSLGTTTFFESSPLPPPKSEA